MRFARTATTLIVACVGLAVAGDLFAASVDAAVIHEHLGDITRVPAQGPLGEAVPDSGKFLSNYGLTVGDGSLWVIGQKPDSGAWIGRGSSGGAVEPIDRFSLSDNEFESQLPLESQMLHTGEPHVSMHYFEGFAVRDETASLKETELYAPGLRIECAPAPATSCSGSEDVVAVFDRAGDLQATWNGSDTPAKFETGEARVSDIAVDNSRSPGDWAAGDAYVAVGSQSRPELNVVDIFRPEAGGGEKYVGRLPGPHAGVFGAGQHGIAVDEANGDVIVAEGETTKESAVYVFEPTALESYALVRKITGPPGGAFNTTTSVYVGVDGGTGTGEGDVYVSNGGHVYEFDVAGGYRGQIPIAHPGGRTVVDPVSHRLYVAEAQSGDVSVFGPDLVVPDVTTGAVSAVTPSSAVVHGTVNALGEGPARCWFAWGVSEELESKAECPTQIEGSATQSVEATLEGLSPDTKYYYRLQSSNKNGRNTSPEATELCEGKLSVDACFTTSGPGLREEFARDVTATSATLGGRVSPHGRTTGYFFEYSTGDTSACDTDPELCVAAPGARGVAIGSGEEAVSAGPVHLQGLRPGVVYHYRIVALTEMSPGEIVAFHGADETFTTQTPGVEGLPDDRRWELVSPAQKNGALVEPIGKEGLIQAAADGGSFTFHTNQPTEADPAGYANQEQVLAVRGGEGWSSRDISIAHAPAAGQSEGVGEDYRFFGEDLARAVVQPAGAFIPASSPQAIAPRETSEQTAFLREDFDPAGGVCALSCYRPLVTGMPGFSNVPAGARFGEEGQCPDVAAMCGPQFVGASGNGEHVILKSSASLTEDAVSGLDYLYEWTDGRLALVSVLPGGGPAKDPVFQDWKESARHGVSEDGSRVFWHTNSGSLHLYMTDTVSGKSVLLDAVQGGDGGGSADPMFQTASADGSRAYFVDSQKLTVGASGGGDLYECVIVEEAGAPRCSLSDLTVTSGEEAAGLLGGVLGAGEDGSWVYFVADGVPRNGGTPVSGAVKGTCTQRFEGGELCNLYVYHEGVVRLVALLSGEDAADWGRGGDVSQLTARVSPDGEWLAFMSDRELTGYDNHDAETGAPDEEVYLYHATGGEVGALVCASCDPTGGRPVGEPYVGESLYGGNGVWETNSRLAANIPGWTPYRDGDALYQSRYLSDSGRLFFNSMGALAPQDVNGTWDVYEYEPPGVGDCTVASVRSGRCVGLISSGASAEESAFLDAGETGADVFFVTLAKLTSADFDQALDVYDAHECSAASPCVPEAPQSPPACSNAESCRVAPAPQPEVFGSPASATFSGPGSPVVSGSAPVVVRTKTKPAGKARRRKTALRACRKDRRGRKRMVCERAARRRYRGRAAHVRSRGVRNDKRGGG